MQSPIVAIARSEVWEESKKKGLYTQSTITSSLEDVGFIHCSTPDQTIDIANRHFTNFDNVVLLIIDTEKVIPEVRFEKALSGRPGLFPHIYGALNTDSVIEVLVLKKNNEGKFIAPSPLFE